MDVSIGGIEAQTALTSCKRLFPKRFHWHTCRVRRPRVASPQPPFFRRHAVPVSLPAHLCSDNAPSVPQRRSPTPYHHSSL